jgi:hypothetical protein
VDDDPMAAHRADHPDRGDRGFPHRHVHPTVRLLRSGT